MNLKDWKEKRLREGILSEAEWEAAAAKAFREVLAPIIDAFRPGTDLGDLLVIAYPKTPEGDRLAAVRRFTRRHKPIHPKRWARIGDWIKRELIQSAKTARPSIEDEITFRAMSGLFIVAQLAGRPPIGLVIRNEARIVSWVLRKLNELVTEDILGPEWRRRSKEVTAFAPDADLASDEEAAEPPPGITPKEEFHFASLPNPEKQYESEITFDQLLDGAPLSDLQNSILRAVHVGYEPADVAEILDKSKEAVRAALFKGRLKVEKPARKIFPKS